MMYEAEYTSHGRVGAYRIGDRIVAEWYLRPETALSYDICPLTALNWAEALGIQPTVIKDARLLIGPEGEVRYRVEMGREGDETPEEYKTWD